MWHWAKIFTVLICNGSSKYNIIKRSQDKSLEYVQHILSKGRGSRSELLCNGRLDITWITKKEKLLKEELNVFRIKTNKGSMLQQLICSWWFLGPIILAPDPSCMPIHTLGGNSDGSSTTPVPSQPLHCEKPGLSCFYLHSSPSCGPLESKPADGNFLFVSASPWLSNK